MTHNEIRSCLLVAMIDAPIEIYDILLKAWERPISYWQPCIDRDMSADEIIEIIKKLIINKAQND